MWKVTNFTKLAFRFPVQQIITVSNTFIWPSGLKGRMKRKTRTYFKIDAIFHERRGGIVTVLNEKKLSLE